MRHTHWSQDLLDRLFVNAPPAPVCDLPTKKACDERVTQWSHDHLGQPCEKRVEPGNKVATCVLRPGAEKRGSR